MITQRKFDELQLAAQVRAEALFEKWLERFLGNRAAREDAEEEQPLDEEGVEIEPELEVENA